MTILTMFALNPSTHYLRKAKKLVRKNPKLKKCIGVTLSQLESDPFSLKLKTHKGIARHDKKMAYSARVTDDLRILWRFHEGVSDLLDIIDVGGHSGKGKVYV